MSDINEKNEINKTVLNITDKVINDEIYDEVESFNYQTEMEMLILATYKLKTLGFNEIKELSEFSDVLTFHFTGNGAYEAYISYDSFCDSSWFISAFEIKDSKVKIRLYVDNLKSLDDLRHVLKKNRNLFGLSKKTISSAFSPISEEQKQLILEEAGYENISNVA